MGNSNSRNTNCCNKTVNNNINNDNKISHELPKTPMELHYWEIKGRGEPARILLKILHAEFKNVYPQFEEYHKTKDNNGMPFPNLPCLVDGDLKITESLSINLYLAENYKPEMLGKNKADKAYVKTIMFLATDIKSAIFDVMFAEKLRELFPQKMKTIQSKLGYIDRFIGPSKKFCFDYLTLADIEVVHTLIMVQYLLPHFGMKIEDTGFKNLERVMGSFMSVPEIKAYLESEEFNARPLMPPMYIEKFEKSLKA